MQTEEQVFQSSPGLSTLTTPELCHVSDTEGNYCYGAQAESQPTIAADGVVRFNPGRMESGEPYPFRLADSWFIAVKRPEGHIDFFFVQ